jgi:predicted transposase/invertase (TIGR01784 family)
MDKKERWAAFFRYCAREEKRDLINELLEEEEGITMAGETVLTVSQDEREWARLESEYKYKMDQQSRLAVARKEGRAESRLEIARKLKDLGILPDQITEATGLTLEVIEKL